MALTDHFMDENLEPLYEIREAQRKLVETVKAQAIIEFLAQLNKELEHQVLPNLNQELLSHELINYLQEKRAMFIRMYMN